MLVSSKKLACKSEFWSATMKNRVLVYQMQSINQSNTKIILMQKVARNQVFYFVKLRKSNNKNEMELEKSNIYTVNEYLITIHINSIYNFQFQEIRISINQC
ncbi:hypothetical protein BpHYR1_051933 [Brachionus plicatilis]|uniref:Uncharacterized protein n=1 Tax=Brachionus plicatilis TaxID=10195 RepID=A0A3M7SHN3_BRAPC|nr:hypothetical protein BpHYR1_051933 [Brachionus plicatilis]